MIPMSLPRFVVMLTLFPESLDPGILARRLGLYIRHRLISPWPR